MWIKHNNAMYNTNYITKIEQERTKIIAEFQDGEKIVIGNFRLIKEAQNIFQSITRTLLTEDKDAPGIIIRDTKVENKKPKMKRAHLIDIGEEDKR